MNQPLYNDLLNAAFVLTSQEENQKKIKAKQNEIARREQNLRSVAEDRKPRGYTAKKVWGIILIVFGVYGLFGGALLAFSGTGDKSAVLIPIVGLASLIIAICLLKSARKALDEHVYQNNWLLNATRQENDQKNRVANTEIARLNAENEQLKASEPETIAFLPDTYRNTQAACYMLLAVKDGRADTLKEAMNLYEEQLHRWKMEKLAADSARMQQIQLEAMQELAANQEQIQTQLSVITALQVADMLRD